MLLARFTIARGSSQWLRLLRCVTHYCRAALHPGDTWVISRGYSGYILETLGLSVAGIQVTAMVQMGFVLETVKPGHNLDLTNVEFMKHAMSWY